MAYKMFEFLDSINSLMWWVLVAAILFFILSSLDSFFFDCVYWIKRFTKDLFQKKEKKLYYDNLVSLTEKRIALMVPCWQEAGIIREMLRSNISEIDYANYDVFVGLYPNDTETIAEVKRAQAKFENLYCAMNSNEGPSTKGDNLNSIYQYICQHELENKISYDFYVIHSAEDIIHPLSFRLYNYATDQYDMIQTPVFPLEVPLSNFTHWVYNDEFAEVHISTLLVRGLIHGLVPSAGVGTAFTRKAVDLLVEQNENKMPFSLSSVTEGYDASLRLQKLKMKVSFLPFSITRVVHKKKWFGFGGVHPVEKEQIVATRALFPSAYLAAIRQRTRWVYGIVLQEWKEIGWPGSFAMRLTLFHDRKSIFTHFIYGISCLILLFWLASFLTGGFHYHLMTLENYLEVYPWMNVLIVIGVLLMIERIINRAVFTGTIYGFWPAVLSIPRIIYGGMMNFHASYNALRNFLRASSKNEKIIWGKGGHKFPSPDQMSTYRRKVGDIMLDEGMISVGHLKKAIKQQATTTDKIGQILLEHGYIDLKKLTDLLAHQSRIGVIDAEGYSVVEKSALQELSSSNYQWLLSKELLPINLSENTLTIAVTNPALLSNYDEIIEKIAPYHVKFVLISLAHKLGDILVRKGVVTPAQIASAIAEQMLTREKVGPILLKKGYITHEDLILALSEQYNLEVVNAEFYPILNHSQLPEIDTSTYEWLLKNNFKPIECENESLTLVIADPANERLRKEAMRRLLPYEVNFVMSSDMN